MNPMGGNVVLNIYDLLRSGRVKRWHHNPDMADTGENDAEHQWMVAALILFLRPDAPRDLLIEALWHDVGELVAGDLGAPFKDANPEIAAAHAAFELDARRKICPVMDISPADALWLKLADRMAAYIWMLMKRPHLAARLDWIGDYERLMSMADDLGVKARVRAAVADFAGVRVGGFDGHAQALRAPYPVSDLDLTAGMA